MNPTRLHFTELGIELKRIKTSGKTLCPKCSHTRKKKSDPCLSVDLEKGVYMCHNCGWSGRYFEKIKKKEYLKPAFINNTSLSNNLVHWFFKRGISQKTLSTMKVTESQTYLPQTQTQRNCINFNYFRNDELINIKYRDGAKNFKMYKDAELIFYNLDSIKNSDTCIIVEGEIDVLSWIEAGFPHVVSVPNGASKNSNLEYLDHCYEEFQHLKTIIIDTDNDEVGLLLRDELARRLGYERCYKLPKSDFKDANELLMAKGAAALVHRFELKEPFPINGILYAEDFKAEVLDFWENGVPEGLRAGIPGLDDAFRLLNGQLITITGVPSHGKSGFLEQFSLKLAVNHEHKFAVFTPESYPYSMYFSRLIKKLTGKKVSKNKLSINELENALEWVNHHFFMINPEEQSNLDDILSKAEELVKRKGVKHLIIDPFNRIESGVPQGMNETTFISKQLDKITAFNHKNNVNTFVVAHPTKMKKDPHGAYEKPSLYDISGSANFYNKSDVGITVHRNKESTSVVVLKVKWETQGTMDSVVDFVFNPENTRLINSNEHPSNNWISERDLKAASQIPTIEIPAGENYKINFENGDIYAPF